ncbi:MAG: zf-HC2 domain-containing protein, partial [Acidimicrobiales bacterium]
LLTCREAREAVSARLDGERPPVSETDTAGHLARCSACREFDRACRGIRTDLVDLARRARVQATRPAPDGLTRMLYCLSLDDTAGRPRFELRRSDIAVRRALRWVAATAPAGLAVLGLPLALAHPPHILPSHVPTPCTSYLQAHHGASR